MCEIRNKILIIGTDDHNTLAVVRDLGKHDCNISVLIHGDFTSIHDVKISKSRYGKNKTDYVNDSIEKIYEWIKRNAKQKSNLKTILFPCSDLAAYTVDYYGKELSNCIIPGFKGQPGRVVELMDKINQKKFADCYGIPMAKTWCYKITNANKIVIPYPCILKPEISAKGRKGDIRICRNSVEFESAVKMLEANGYEEVVLQEFLVKQYEVCALGCIIDEMPQRYIGGYIKKLREWPIGGGGNMSCSRFIQTPELDEIIHKVTRVLYEQGYRGMYDIEFLVCDNGLIYLNEINFRHSGNGFGLIDNGVYAPYYFCKSCAGMNIETSDLLIPKVGKVIMEEVGDFKHRTDYNLSTISWIKEFVYSSAYSVINLNDISGTVAFLGDRLQNLLKKLKKNK